MSDSVYPIAHRIENKRNFVPIDQDKGKYKYHGRRKGSTLYIYEYEDRLVFWRVEWVLYRKKIYADKTMYILSYKNGSYNLYRKKQAEKWKLQNISTSNSNITRTKRGERKANAILRSFAKRHGFKGRLLIGRGLDVNIKMVIYPMINHLVYRKSLEDFKIRAIDISRLGKHFRKQNLTEMVKSLTGFKGKELKKLIWEQLPQRLLLLRTIDKMPKRYLNQDKLQTFIKNNSDGRFLPYDIDQGFTGLSLSHKKYILKSLLEVKDKHAYLLTDTARMLRKLPEVDVSQFDSLEHLHDELALIIRRKANEDVQYSPPKKWLKIDNVAVEDMTIVLPKTRHELIAWSTQMKNCIASYHDSFHEKRTLLLGVKKDDKIVYNISINNNLISQFYGTANSPPKKDDYEKVVAVLADKKIIRSTEVV